MVAARSSPEVTRGLSAHWEDHYAVLGVPINASPEQIKQAYRRVAKALRRGFVGQSVDQQAGRIFAQIVNPAKAVLTKPAEKADYDTTIELLIQKMSRGRTFESMMAGATEVISLFQSPDWETLYPQTVEVLAGKLYTSLDHLPDRLNELSELNLAYLFFKHKPPEIKPTDPIVTPKPASVAEPKPAPAPEPKPTPVPPVNALKQEAQQRYQQALTLNEQGLYQAAIQALGLAISKDPTATEYYLQRARIQRHLKQPDLARSDYDEVIQRDPHNIEAMQGLRDVLKVTPPPHKVPTASVPNPKTAKPELAEAERHYQQAVKAIEQKQYDAAVQSLTLAISKDPRRLDYYLERARLYRRLQETDLARSDYDEVIQLDPHHSEALQGLRDILRSSMTPVPAPVVAPPEPNPEAERRYQQALQMMERGQHREAISYLNLAIDRDPHWIPYILTRAQLQKTLNNIGMARADYKRVLQLDPNHVEALQEVKLAADSLPPQPIVQERQSQIAKLLFMNVFPSSRKTQSVRKTGFPTPPDPNSPK